MTLYAVTAGNRFFWMDLAVRAESREAAEKAFSAYLEQTRSEEDYEYGEALKGPEDLQNFSREDFSYGFDEDTINDDDGGLKGYVGEIGRDVVMLRSGGNG